MRDFGEPDPSLPQDLVRRIVWYSSITQLAIAVVSVAAMLYFRSVVPLLAVAVGWGALHIYIRRKWPQSAHSNWWGG
jgi:hypothetical protein